MTPDILLPLSGLIPLLVVLAGWVKPFRSLMPMLGVLATLPAIYVAYALPQGASFALMKGHIEVAWELDATAQIFLRFTSVAWGLAAVFAAVYLWSHPRRSDFWFFFLPAMAGNFLLIPAVDVLTFFTGFAVMGFAGWGLVTFDATPAALRAGRLFLAMVVLGEALILPGVVKSALLAGSTRMDIIQAGWTSDPVSLGWAGLLLVGFGIKAGMIPLHFWLPIAHPVAPAPASAVLSGCMIKAGVLGWLRFLPLDSGVLPELGPVFAGLGALGLMAGGILGALQPQPKAALAYATVQAAGLLMLLLAPAFWLPGRAAVVVPAVGLYAAFHSLHKTALFLGTAANAGGRLLIPYAILAASYAGVPGLAGYGVKSEIKSVFYRYPEQVQDLLLWTVTAGSALTVILLGRVLFGLQAAATSSSRFEFKQGVWLLSLAPVLALPLLGRFTAPWPVDPVAAGSLLAGLLVLLAGGRLWADQVITLPPGDIGIPLEKFCSRGAARTSSRLAILEEKLAGPMGALAILAVLLTLLGAQLLGD